MQKDYTPESSSIPYGYCHCGCGGRTSRSRDNDSTRGYVKGEPMRFLYNHHKKNPEPSVIEWDEGNQCLRVHLSSQKYPGRYALVDPEDISLVSGKRWGVVAGHQTLYAATGNRGDKMHRVIMSETSSLDVDHINHDGLDNRRSNLRLATRSENSRNQRMQVNNTSGYKGVSRRKDVWIAQIRHEGKAVSIGRFTTPEAAASAYDLVATRYYGEYSSTNKSLGLLSEADTVKEQDLPLFMKRPRGRWKNGEGINIDDR